MTSMQIGETASIDLTKLSAALSAHCKIIERGIAVVTLKNKGRQQEQLIIIPPRTVVPLHRHEGVVNFIQPLWGRAKIRKDGVTLTIDGFKHPREYKIEAGQLHGIRTFKEQFVFLSQQVWLPSAGKMKSIEQQWKGRCEL